MSKKQDVGLAYMAQSYLVAPSCLLGSWAVISFFNNMISGIVFFVILVVVALIGVYCIRKYDNK